MAIKVKCPACQSTVHAAESERGTTIKCGTCWADVAVPNADPDADVVKAVALPPLPAGKPLPATPAAPVAKALPLDGAKPPTAVSLPLTAPAVAKPAVLNPIDARSRDRERDEERGRGKDRPRFRDRDDDDDDRPIRSEKSGGGKGMLFVLLGVGTLMVGGLVGGVVLLLNSGANTPGTETAGGTGHNDPTGNNPINPNWKAGGDPRRLGDFNPPPQENAPKPAPAGWKEHRTGEFVMLAPGEVKKENTTFAHGGKFYEGSKHAAEGDGVRVTAQELRLPAGVRPDAVTTPGFVAAAVSALEEKVRKTDGRPMPHGPGVEFATTEVGGDTGAVLVTQTAAKVFVFHIRWKPNLADGLRRRNDFFNSVRILGGGAGGDDPEVLAGGGPKRQPRVNPFDPFDPQGPERIVTPWKAVENKGGFTADAPPGVTREKHTLELDGRLFLGGMKYSVDDGRCAYWMYHHDLAPGQDLDLQKIAGKLVHEVFPHEVNGSEDGKLDGKAATKWTIRHFHGGLSSGYSVKLGYRVFTFFVTSKQGIHRPNGDPTLEGRQTKFFESIKLPFDPKGHDPLAGEPEWVAMAKTVGFTVTIPRQATTEGTFTPIFGLDVPVGKTYKAEVDGIVYEAFVIDLSVPPRKRPTDPARNPEDVVKWLTDNRPVADVGKAKLGGLDGEAYTLKRDHDRPMYLRAAGSGAVIYAARTSLGWDSRKVGDKEFADKTAKFFDSFRTGAGGGGATGGPGGGGGEVGAGPASGEFVALAAGKVKPFWAAVVLAGKQELITVGVRDANATPPGGVLRRYALPDFKLKATYHLSHPAHRAAADEKGGKLYLASVSAAADAKLSEREAAVVGGDVQVFDLKKLTDGTLGELDEVKPTATLYVGSRIAGLEVSPAGDAVYVGCVTQSGTKQRPVFRGKLTKFDPATGKSAGDLPSDSPVWAMELSADGRRLAVLERPLDGRAGGNLILLDGPNWKRIKSTPLSGVPLDVALLGERAVALEAANGAAKLTVAAEDGETAEVPLGGDARYLRATRDGKRLLVSVGAPGVGLTLFGVTAGKTPTLTKKATATEAGGTALGGLVTVSADGKLAVLNTGAVIDLDRSGGR